MSRSYYSADIPAFLVQTENHLLGELVRNHEFTLDDNQKNAWLSQIKILKRNLRDFSEGTIIFEYTIPRVGKRIDNVFLYNGIIFLFEFKVGAYEYFNYAIEQVMDYALD